MLNWGLCLPFSGVSAWEVCLGVKAPVPPRVLECRAFVGRQAMKIKGIWEVWGLFFSYYGNIPCRPGSNVVLPLLAKGTSVPGILHFKGDPTVALRSCLWLGASLQLYSLCSRDCIINWIIRQVEHEPAVYPGC